MWIWGGTSRGKLGLNLVGKDQLEPVNIEFEVVYKEKNEEIEVALEPFTDENKRHKKFNTEYIEEFQSISWGIDHCVFVDKKSRVFSMGCGKHGRLGHGDEKDKGRPQLVKDLEGKGILDVQCGIYHSLAISKNGDIYSWGWGQSGRLGLGYDQDTRSNMNQFTPKKIDVGIDDNYIMNVSCGKNINCVAVKSGTLYTWGKGEHEKPKFDDYIEYATPFPMIEDKYIAYVSCGTSHAMALDQNGRLYGWGEGKEGCLGLGDGKKRLSVCPISFFENKRCIDVACGDNFTVVIAEVFNDYESSNAADLLNNSGPLDLANGLITKLQKQKNQHKITKSARKPLCGGDNLTENLKSKIMDVMKRNQERQQTTRNQRQNIDMKGLSLPRIEQNPQIFNTIDDSARMKDKQELSSRRAKLYEQANRYQTRMNPTVQDIIMKSKVNEDQRGDKTISYNELINEESLQYFIETSFKTRGITPMKNSRWKTAFYIDEVCSDKPKIMRKLRKIKYNDFFSGNFQVQRIDSQFKELENTEKVKVIDNVIDLLFQDLKQLKKKKKLDTITKEDKLELRQKELGLHQMTQFEQIIANDPQRVTTFMPFQANINFLKLKKKNINISPSIAYKRPENKIYVGGNALRTLKKDEARAKSVLR